MIHSHIIPLIITKYVTKYADHGNSVHKHALITLLKIMRRLTKISYTRKYQLDHLQNYLNMNIHRRCIPIYMCNLRTNRVSTVCIHVTVTDVKFTFIHI